MNAKVYFLGLAVYVALFLVSMVVVNLIIHTLGIGAIAFVITSWLSSLIPIVASAYVVGSRAPTEYGKQSVALSVSVFSLSGLLSGNLSAGMDVDVMYLAAVISALAMNMTVCSIVAMLAAKMASRMKNERPGAGIEQKSN